MLKLYSYGKINLFLDIEGTLKNGYHLIKTVMQSIDLHDEVIIESIDKNKIVIECSDSTIPVDEKNTCHKAATIIKQMYNINLGVNIKINKKIPSEAGLAGGSSNSAAVIAGLNKLWKLNISENEMLKIGLKIGADVPFCLLGGTYLAEGIGEKLTKLNNYKWENILIIKPDFSMSTAFVYNNLTTENYNLYSNNNILNYISENKFYETSLSASNALEKAVEKFHPEINDIKNFLIKNGALCSKMTGSGSAIFGLFECNESLNNAYNKAIEIYPQVFKTKTSAVGINFYV
ncbi:MAG: 4-(cytidine 5'-diphospho)-2-C-methyl-D-erythritol kinase [Sedimentibacter sp.]|uniref:4-(cytidine 5'-diphospho)-2-C-methyl-D-erythritol kinase n=1 Tax=Sedimentibacter sp. TaxID=1960295 RepID=UPI0029817F84|nr:4-(cytidine 5'-diphospho)-2-C-methyl-D-erythritol kinase [Sedimentibacter sp.]MDW5299771.1 4-(cytidine 5'-diphospho)-2-C-methyl-D-erythritol kinase [Sedimentibacter sp.]